MASGENVWIFRINTKKHKFCSVCTQLNDDIPAWKIHVARASTVRQENVHTLTVSDPCSVSILRLQFLVSFWSLSDRLCILQDQDI